MVRRVLTAAQLSLWMVGRVGKACIAFLAQSGRCTVRATTRDLSKADYLKGIGAHEVVELDLIKQDTWEQAVQGCTAVFSSSMDRCGTRDLHTH